MVIMIKILPTFLICVLSTVSAHFLIKANALRDISNLTGSSLHLMLKTYSHPFFIAGACWFGIGLLFYNKLLSEFNLNIAFPMFTGINFSLIILGSHYFFKENISIKHAIGLTLILSGVILLSTLTTKTSH